VATAPWLALGCFGISLRAARLVVSLDFAFELLAASSTMPSSGVKTRRLA